ncbi:MAG: hypothetical protein RPS47_06140 [Colwellia sp.]
MSRKETTTKAKPKNETEDPSTDKTASSAQAKSTPKKEGQSYKVIDNFTNIVLKGDGLKLSPKTKNRVFYEIAVNAEDQKLYLRLISNEGGGLHSKEWIKIEDVINLLDKQGDRSFKSTIFKTVFKGLSANNAAFLAAALRADDIKFITHSEKSVFLHTLPSDYEDRKARLLALTP